jgi:hypothetical protein
LAVIVPFAERHVQAFGGMAGQLGREYNAVCEKSGIAPDAVLLQRVARALGGGMNEDPKPGQPMIDKISDNPIMKLFRNGIHVFLGGK